MIWSAQSRKQDDAMRGIQTVYQREYVGKPWMERRCRVSNRTKTAWANGLDICHREKRRLVLESGRVERIGASNETKRSWSRDNIPKRTCALAEICGTGARTPAEI